MKRKEEVRIRLLSIQKVCMGKYIPLGGQKKNFRGLQSCKGPNIGFSRPQPETFQGPVLDNSFCLPWFLCLQGSTVQTAEQGSFLRPSWARHHPRCQQNTRIPGANTPHPQITSESPRVRPGNQFLMRTWMVLTNQQV